jgi:hypothetical protein
VTFVSGATSPALPDSPAGGLKTGQSVDSSAAPQRTGAKVVYFVASHVHPPQVVRLVRALRTGGSHSRVLIHHDYRVSDLDPASVECFGNVDVLLPPSPVQYGGFGSCMMVLRAMRWLIERRNFDWVVYLSGQDYPIRPLAAIEQSLGETSYDGFLDAVKIDDAQWFLGIERYLYRYYNLPNIPGLGRLRNFLARRGRSELARGNRKPRFHVPKDRWGKMKLGVRPLFGPFSQQFPGYVGSSWWTLSRTAIEFMLDFVHKNPALSQHYWRVLFAPNESFLLTVLLNNPQLRLTTRDNRRFIQWTHPETGHPDLLEEKDFEALAASGCDFARKIDERVSPGLVDRLDRSIGVA